MLFKFNEADPDDFFSFFEKLHRTHNWSDNQHVNIIAPSLPTTVNYIYLSKDDDVPYDYLKADILTAYACVPDVYRTRFRTRTKQDTQTYSDYAYKITTLFNKWLDSKRITNLNKLKELIKKYKNSWIKFHKISDCIC